MPGKTISQYTLIEELKTGEFGVLHKAEDGNNSGANVLVLVFHEELGRNQEYLNALKLESASIRRMTHPNVLAFKELVMPPETPAVVFEYLDALDAADALKTESFNEKTVLDIGYECLKALAYAHKKGVIHRDIRPENILLCPNGSLKLRGFGMRKTLDVLKLSEAGVLKESLNYTAPELLEGNRASPGSDIYSLGLCLWELLVGKTACVSGGVSKKKKWHIGHEIEDLRELCPECPAALVDVIMLMTNSDIKLRPETVTELLQVWPDELDAPSKKLTGRTPKEVSVEIETNDVEPSDEWDEVEADPEPEPMTEEVDPNEDSSSFLPTLFALGGLGALGFALYLGFYSEPDPRPAIVQIPNAPSELGVEINDQIATFVDGSWTVPDLMPGKYTMTAGTDDGRCRVRTEISVPAEKDAPAYVSEPLACRPVSFLLPKILDSSVSLTLDGEAVPEVDGKYQIPLLSFGSHAIELKLEGEEGVEMDPCPAAVRAVASGSALQEVDLRQVCVGRLGYKTAKLSPGSFERPSSENDSSTVAPVMSKIDRGFELGVVEVTQGLYRKIMGGNPSLNSACGDNCPVEGVNWCQAILFANFLSTLEGLDPAYALPEFNGAVRFSAACVPAMVRGVKSLPEANGYRLPTVLEWEYAAIAGSPTLYSGSNNPDTVSWNASNSGPASRPVGTKTPNALGIHDLNGNVSEWCQDVPENSGPADPKNLERIFRGGDYTDSAAEVRSSSTQSAYAGYRAGTPWVVGFRLARSLD